jgi:hypothetical protein
MRLLNEVLNATDGGCVVIFCFKKNAPALGI